MEFLWNAENPKIANLLFISMTRKAYFLIFSTYCLIIAYLLLESFITWCDKFILVNSNDFLP